ncbi:MAG: addiction module protein [Limisphaerales bacterium]
MPANNNRIVEAALALPPGSRARLAEKLLASLDQPGQKDVDALRAREAEDRIDAFDAGQLRAISGASVFRALKSRKR